MRRYYRPVTSLTNQINPSASGKNAALACPHKPAE